MLLAARALGLGATLTTRHAMYAAEVDAIFGLPDNVTALAIVPIGFPPRSNHANCERDAPFPVCATRTSPLETLKTARLAFRGKLMVFAAVSAGKMNKLAAFDDDFLAEIGIISAAGSTVSEYVKNVAVNVVLKKPVYVESIRFPKSKMSFWGWFQK
jgi:hypothetical protein